MIEKDEYLKQKGISVEFAQGKVEELCFSLHYISLKRDLKPSHAIFNRLQDQYALYTQKMDELIESSQLILDKPIDESQFMRTMKWGE